jgi:uncharacterized membrane protein
MLACAQAMLLMAVTVKLAPLSKVVSDYIQHGTPIFRSAFPSIIFFAVFPSYNGDDFTPSRQ